MDTIRDFEDLLVLFQRHKARYLIVGGLAFIYHAKPRYTKDIDLWIDALPANILRANRALREFGSPFLLEAGKKKEIVQLGIAPNRIDLIRTIEGMEFDKAWKKRKRSFYGKASANWIDLDRLIDMKKRINNPRHQEDARILMEIRKRGLSHFFG
ncbi:MAG: hypothetical protein L6437_01770 [Kiritimatiellae bacterium]|nr:hypothetical protein [Verrucomicrobiota bacterium]MBU4366625.1 hypothetical protein [Verrucomicrobiota bacterium]MCG2658958.1 hypothetical protein [Kiritimatiellia bacterium]